MGGSGSVVGAVILLMGAVPEDGSPPTPVPPIDPRGATAVVVRLLLSSFSSKSSNTLSMSTKSIVEIGVPSSPSSDSSLRDRTQKR